MDAPKSQVLYGYCPVCGARGVSRQRRPDGDDICINRHIYKSVKAVYPKEIEETSDSYSI